MPDENTQRAIQALARLGKNMTQSGSPVSGADVMLPGDTPGEAHARLFGPPKREDVNLPAEPPPTGFSWLMQRLKGAFSPAIERPMNDTERQAEALGNVYTGGRR